MLTPTFRTTKCDEHLLFSQPLVPKDLLMSKLHYNLPETQALPQNMKISIQNRNLPTLEEERNENEGPYLLKDRLIGDVAIGTAVTFCVSPFLSIVDKAIVQRAAGSHTLYASGVDSIKTIIRSPIKYVRSPTFLWLWAVGAATYSTANSLKTYTEYRDIEERKSKRSSGTSRKQGNNATLSIDSGLAVFMGTSVVNSTCSLFKDRAFARMFGTVSKKSVPKISYALWISRDLLVIGSSFILPDMVAKHWGEEYKQVAQAGIPIATQFLAGPLQLLGLDFYNRPLENLTTRQAVLDRAKFLKQGIPSNVSARIARIIPGYSIGGVMNNGLRDRWRSYLSHEQQSPIFETMHTMRQMIATKRLTSNISH